MSSSDNVDNLPVEQSTVRASLRLWYFAQAYCELPSSAAHSVQIMKACHAFAQAGAKTTLVLPYRLDTPARLRAVPGNLWDMYSVERNFEVAWCYFFYPFKRLQHAIYAPLAGVMAAARRVRLAITRSAWVSTVLAAQAVPVILELHHYPSKMAARLAARQARSGRLLGLVTTTRALASQMISLGFPPDTVMVASNGVDPGGFANRLSRDAARRQLGLAPGGPVVCYSGTLHNDPGAAATLFACAARLPRVTFMVVGGRPEHVASLRARAAAAGLDNLRFIGHVSNGLVPAYLFASDVLLLPYTTDTPTHAYMSPMKMFEYLLSGRPIIASDFPVLREVLSHGHNALLAAPGSAPAFVAAIETLISDDALAHSLSAQALVDSRAHTWLARQQRILEFIEQRQSVTRPIRHGVSSGPRPA